MDMIFLAPVFKQMVWGGDRLRTEFGYDIPGDDTGECWAISAHQNIRLLSIPYMHLANSSYFLHYLSSLFHLNGASGNPAALYTLTTP
jgi:hypothetical protein